MFKIDDIFAALVLCLAAFRRLEVKSTQAPPHVVPPRFVQWQQQAVGAYSLLALSSAAKVALSMAWFALAVRFEIGSPWLQLGGFSIFAAWVVLAITSWKRITDARHLRVQLGIRLGRQRAPRPQSSES